VKRRVLSSGIEKTLQRVMGEWLGDEQFRRPPFQRLPAEVDLNRGRRHLRAAHQEIPERPLILEALDYESVTLVPFDIGTRKLIIDWTHRGHVPGRTRPDPREHFRYRRDRPIARARDK
jgi:hypothetical protein